ncbi:hypothetical protein SO802_025099 [Lithocarpus litseifolius]|uniref:NUC153 domain-containing protein n=1 Tax=Lithocarpus litseifolius TaxID=425828 RepID=A0AAW2BVX8_9ROSI
MTSKKKNNKKQPKLNKDSEPSPTAQDSNNGGGKKIITDARFASVHSDPRFQNFPRHKSKVAIDSRFDRMFKDKSFASSSAPLDKRGKRKQRNQESHLRHYYKIEEEEKEKEEEKKEISSSSDEEEEEEDDDDEKVVEDSRFGKLESETDSEESEPENGELEESTTDTDDTDEDDEAVYEEEAEEDPLMQENIPEIEKETHRLAVVNMDWKYVKAVDLYVVLSSFLPKGGQILSVAVYPSEFGLQRMKEEAVRGPLGFFKDENEKNEDQDDDKLDSEDDDEIDYEKLRAYEISRLRYYYAVVECDSSATADYLYKSCDGTEFERSSNKLDLRFIPDSMEFKHPPRDVANEVPADYEGLDFQTKALQHSRVQLSWDEDEPDRVKTLKRKFNADQLAQLELKEFLASDEGESDDGDGESDDDDKKDKKRDMYRALVQSGDGSDGDGDGEEDGQDMEVTFNTGLEDISKRILEKKDKNSETVWEAYLRKRREKKQARKNKSKYSSDDDSSDSDTDQHAPEQPDDFFVEEPSVKRSKKEAGGKSDKERLNQNMDKEAEASQAELELLLADDKGTETGLKGYSLKPKKAKGKKGKEVPDEDKLPSVNYDDPRFSALFTSPLYALDPTDPHFKRSVAYARQVAQRQQNKQGLVETEHLELPTTSHLPSDEPPKKEKHELSSLVKSIKMKSKPFQLPSDGKMSKKVGKLQSAGMVEKELQHDLSTLVRSVKKKSKNLKK